MDCNYCNTEKGKLEHKDKNGWQICEDCYDREVLVLCPICKERCEEDNIDYSYITLEDGIYQSKDKNNIRYGLGQIMSELVLIEKDKNDIEFPLESHVNGVCKECISELIT